MAGENTARFDKLRLPVPIPARRRGGRNTYSRQLCVPSLCSDTLLLGPGNLKLIRAAVDEGRDVPDERLIGLPMATCYNDGKGPLLPYYDLEAAPDQDREAGLVEDTERIDALADIAQRLEVLGGVSGAKVCVQMLKNEPDEARRPPLALIAPSGCARTSSGRSWPALCGAGSHSCAVVACALQLQVQRC
jgi:hypothetical protein